MKDRFGNTPFALIYSNGRQVAFTREEYELAKATARMCRCGNCDCCNVTRYVAEPQTQVTCDKCGKTAHMVDVHTLPDGWERCGHGDDFCDDCMEPIRTALANQQTNTREG